VHAEKIADISSVRSGHVITATGKLNVRVTEVPRLGDDRMVADPPSS